MVAGTSAVIVSGVIAGRPTIGLSPFVAYLGGAGIIAARLARDPGVAPHRALLALGICHWSYGLGFWRGVFWALRGKRFENRPRGHR
jgi:hypothetical protein